MSRGRLDRTAVLDAAERVANRDGFDALSLVAIAREVGVQPPSLYNHIDGLPGIRHGLHLRGLTLAVSEIQQATAGTSGATTLRAIATTLRDMAHAHPALYAAVQAPIGDRERDQELREAARVIRAIYREALDALGYRGAAALHLMRAIRSAVHGFVDLERTEHFGATLAVDESFDRMLDVLLAGLSTQQTEQ